MILNARLLKAVAQVVTAEDTRYFLHALQVNPDGRVVATNGHALLIGKAIHKTDPADFPTKGLPDERTPISKPTLLSKPILDTLLKVLPSGKRALDILKSVFVAERTVDGKPQAYAAATNLETPVVAPLDLDGTFPNFERVLVKPNHKHVSVTLGAELLMSLCRAALEVGGDNKSGAAITFEVPTDPKLPTRSDAWIAAAQERIKVAQQVQTATRRLLKAAGVSRNGGMA